MVANAEASQELNEIRKKGRQHRPVQSWKEQSDLALNSLVWVLTNVVLWQYSYRDQ